MSIAALANQQLGIGFAVALGVGLLIGLERERRKGQGPQREVAGVRTFTLVALTGAAVQAIGQPLLTAAAALLILSLVGIAYWRSRVQDPGITTEIALFITLLLGVLAVNQPLISAALGVLVAALLILRQPLQQFATQILTEQELRDGLILLAAALIVLPVVPDTSLTWLANINPRRLWLLVVLIMTIQALGYVALRLAEPRVGLALSGLVSGFVSSTATVVTMGQRAREHPELRTACLSGAWFSCAATSVQIALIAAATHAASLERVSMCLIAAFCMSLLLGAAAFRRAGPMQYAVEQGRAFSIKQALGFALLLTGVTAAAGIAQQYAGNAGAGTVAALAGFADAHAAAASLFNLTATGQLSLQTMHIALLVVFSTNTVSKVIAAFSSGDLRYGLVCSAGLIAIAAAAWLPWLWHR
jgi:uncharacterized membrane protein (DUF4010 family)